MHPFDFQQTATYFVSYPGFLERDQRERVVYSGHIGCGQLDIIEALAAIEKEGMQLGIVIIHRARGGGLYQGLQFVQRYDHYDLSELLVHFIPGTKSESLSPGNVMRNH